MTFVNPRLLLAGCALALVSLSAQAQTPPAAPAPASLVIKEVKPDLYMVTGGGGNSTVRLTPAGVIVIDSKNSSDAIFDDLVGKIRALTQQPIVFLVDTHHHADHTGNNGRFIENGARVLAQDNVPRELEKFTPRASDPTAKAPAAPTTTYGERYTIALGGKFVQLMHFAPAHTSGDTVVYFPDLKAVATGDELVAGAPYIDYPGGMSVAGWIASLDQVLKLDWDTAIPGHGDATMKRADMVAFRGKLKTLLDRATALVKAKTPKDQFAAKLKTGDLWTLAPNYWTPARIDGLWAEAGGK